MAVNSITFGGVNSADFGIYISGEGVFNAPKRDVEMIKIPGRNGEFALDNGRFENIEVTYPAFNFEPDDYDTFMQNLSDFRNAICAQRGYQRLTDTFHPDEYRMATYIGGLEIKPVKYNTASEFNIVFDCKPQRWLVSGETAVTVTSGDTLTNPTLFESGPLLEATGSGTIQFNGYEIELASIPNVEVVIAKKRTTQSSVTPSSGQVISATLDTSLLNTGDAIYPEVGECRLTMYLTRNSGSFVGLGTSNETNVLNAYETPVGRTLQMIMIPDFGTGFQYGTSKTITCSATYNYRTGLGADYSETIQMTIAYGGASTYSIAVSYSGTLPANVTRTGRALTFPTMYGSSSHLSASAKCIDCDLGEAYVIENGEYISLNQYIDLGSELPTLGVGENEVTFDNTLTELKVTPRWWKV